MHTLIITMILIFIGRLSLLPLLPKPSLELGPYSQELLKHKTGQSTGRASLSTVLPKGNIKIIPVTLHVVVNTSQCIALM
jgi:hypothetical protein